MLSLIIGTEGVCCWHPAGRVQGCCAPFAKPRAIPPQQSVIWLKMSIVPRVRNVVLDSYRIIDLFSPLFTFLPTKTMFFTDF